ncbi:hypothetical protein ANCCAN_01778 [Ancylostoma caninum]|uniref:Transthyretin-like family protein n=1 Tax=Ancylostoma caninum TaxID=29170 RepID=A0A368H5W3_ANCCA|nr:hypothetical protein ANCCAN_01778 [Ancylostoma caninum]
MDLRSVIVLFLCSLLAVVIGQVRRLFFDKCSNGTVLLRITDDSDTAPYSGRVIPPSYGLGWRGYVMPMYGGEKVRNVLQSQLGLQLSLACETTCF